MLCYFCEEMWFGTGPVLVDTFRYQLESQKFETSKRKKLFKGKNGKNHFNLFTMSMFFAHRFDLVHAFNSHPKSMLRKQLH